jgi:transcriptional regulator with XRE-family HTH domain
LKQNILGKRIKSLRNKNKMTQKEVATALNYSESTISGWETAKREPSFDDLNALAKLFNVSADIFFNGDIEEAKAYQEKYEHYFSTKYMALHKEEHPFLSSLFLASILFTLIAAYTYIDLITYIALIIWSIYITGHVSTHLLSIRKQKRIIHYPNHEFLCFEHHDEESKIKSFQKFNTIYLLFSFVFGLLTILFSYTMLNYAMNVEDVEIFHIIIIIFHFLIHIFVIIVEWTLSKRSKIIDYFVKAPFIRLIRFQLLIIFYVLIFVIVSLTIAIHGPSTQTLFNFSVPFFLSANVFGSVIVYLTNNRFNKGYKVFAVDKNANKKTPIGV